MDSSLILPPQLAAGIPSHYAHALSFLFTTSYVGSLYISQHFFPTSPSQTPSPAATPTHPEDKAPLPSIAATDQDGFGLENSLGAGGPELGSRDHPLTIKRRMTAVSISTLLSISGVYVVVETIGDFTGSSAILPTLALLGLPTRVSLPSGALPYLLAPGIMLGPLYAMYLSREIPIVSWKRRGETWAGMLKREWGLVEWRNYGIGPATEELVFRSTILASSILGGLSLKAMVFGTPMWFGIAHAHHAVELYRKNGRTAQAALQATATCLFQLTYTTLFGYFASYLYLRTGSVLPPLTAHMYCNVMGIYFPGRAVALYPKKKALIWGAYLLGVVGFCLGVRIL